MRFGSLLAALIIGVGGVALSSPQSAAADVTTGHCASDTGVTLVVDFQDLGGSTIIKCIEDVAPGTTGLQILQKAGMNPAGTIHDGPGFVCRINDRPSRTETIPINGNPDYREACRLTPPKTAFWSYWHADNGGSWTFSQYGAGNRGVTIGGYEGWSFSLNRTEDTNPRPGVKPSHPVGAPEPAPAPTTKAPAPAATTKTPEPAPAPTSKAAPEAPSTTATPTTAVPSEGRSSAPATKPETPAPAATPSSADVATEPVPTAVSVTPSQTSATESAEASPPVEATAPNDPPMDTIMGAGAVAALGVGGGIVWWRRRGL